MYKLNEFTKQYYEIIENAKIRGSQYKTRYMAKKNIGYVESHHVVPTALGGSDVSDNKVWLTAHEHLKCHLLLTEMCENEGHRHKMLLAATRMMNIQNSSRGREQILPLQITEEEVAWLSKIRENSAEAHSKYMSNKFKGNNNPFYGKSHTKESNDARSKKLKGRTITEEHRKKTSTGRLKNSKHISEIVTGNKNPRYISTVYSWENIFTNEKKSATRLEMTAMDPALKSHISNVINGTAAHVKGWRLI